MENGYWSLDDLCWRNGIARYRVLDTQDGVWSKTGLPKPFGFGRLY